MVPAKQARGRGGLTTNTGHTNTQGKHALKSTFQNPINKTKVCAPQTGTAQKGKKMQKREKER